MRTFHHTFSANSTLLLIYIDSSADAGGWKQIKLYGNDVLGTVVVMEGKEEGAYSRFYILLSCLYLYCVQKFRIQ
jgi:hypothetical protein